jgi:hypothetical protein
MQSRFQINLSMLLLLVFTFVTKQAIAQIPADTPECSSVATFKYKPNACKVTVHRSDPGSPQPVSVPPNTTVYIDVQNQQPNEYIQAVVVNDALPHIDALGDIIAKLTTPLGSLSLSQSVIGAHAVHPLQFTPAESLEQRQDVLYKTLARYYGAYIEASCLSVYLQYSSSATACLTTPIPNAAAYDAAKAKAIADIDSTVADTTTNPPYIPADLPQLDADVKAFCPTVVPHTNECDRLLSNEQRIDGLASAVAVKGKQSPNPLPATVATLRIVQDQAPTNLVPYKKGPDRKLTVKLNGIEQIASASFNFATVVINWQQTNWGLSTGVVLSALKNKSFANAPMYNSSGQPITDGSGKTYTVVTVSKTYPGIISPVFLVNYRLHNFQADQGRFALLFSAGIGANIFTKSADFAAGPSIQFGSVIFTPAVHYGRQTNLTNGVHVGDQLGTGPPALPTYNPYKPAIGLGITYRIPLT